MTRLSNQAAIRHWQGTKAAPAIPECRVKRVNASRRGSDRGRPLLTHEEADKVETSHVHGGTSETAGDSGEPEGTDENVAL